MIEKLMKLLKIKFQGELVLKDGTPIIVDGDLTVGAKVSVNSPDGTIPLPDGSYELETGQIITVEKGVITDIVEQTDTPEMPDQEPVVEEEAAAPAPTKEAPPAEAPPAETKPSDGMPMEEVMKKLEEIVAKVDELSMKIKDLEDKTSKLSSESDKFNSDLDVIKQKANFVKELPKTTAPEVSATSPLVDKINKIRQLKNK